MPFNRRSVVALSRSYKQGIGVLADALSLWAALLCAYLLRLESVTPPSTVLGYLLLWGLPVLTALAVFWQLGLYKSLVRFMSWRGGLVMAAGAVTAGVTHYITTEATDAFSPRSVPIIFSLLGLATVAGTRSVFRLWFTHGQRYDKEKVIVYGVGPSGISLVSALNQGTLFMPVALVDEDPEKQKTFIHGVYVYSPSDLPKLIKEFGVTRLFLAIENLSKARRAQILQMLEPLAVRVQTVPSTADVISGRARILDIKDVEVEDLLGRDQIKPDDALMQRCITGKVVMVTGAGGSIGSELCRQIIRYAPAKLVMLDTSEFALYQIDQELRKSAELAGNQTSIVSLLGSVQKEHRIEIIMRTFGVQTVYHTAAYKHVPMVEHNVVEGVRNNVFGTWYTAEAAIRTGVETFVLISTDKAVRPTNIMGASKRMAELVLQGLAIRQRKTRFCMVRFGNVLGSSGSVVPLFQEQILKGGPVTVTHPEIIRYFMTIPEAAQLVIQAGSMGQGGEVFLLDMGAPVRIADLARRMIHLMGHSVKSSATGEGEIEIVYTGLRPGEKLYEELLVGDNAEGTAHPRIMMAREQYLVWHEVDMLLKELDKACHTFDCDWVRNILEKAPTGFQPNGDIEDLVWQEHLQNTAGIDLFRNLATLSAKK